MSHDRTVIRHAVEEIGFGFFTEDEIKRLSVKRITSPVTFDTLNNPLPGGLYDPVLGTTEKIMICETCGQDSKNCPGHMGHIELAVPVYNPMLFVPLLKLMRAKCFNCHNLQLSKDKTRIAAVKMMLIDAGRGQEALELDKELLGYLKEDGNQSRNILDENHADAAVAAAKYRERVLSVMEAELAENPRSEWNGGHLRMLRRQVVDEFMAAIGAVKRCENCGAYSPRIQKDGFDKLFQMPLAEKLKVMNHSSKTHLKSAVQGYDVERSGDGNDSDPMSEDDDFEGEDLYDGGASGRVTLSGVDQGSPGKEAAPSKQKKFMPPIEVELQMQLLWKMEHKVLDMVFVAGRRNEGPGGEEGGGYRLFFMRVIAVPPPRFRPPMDMGGMVVEHPQNVHLTKILTANEKLKNTESLEGEALTSVLTTWIELQNRVNGYIDSSKDQTQGKDAMPGLRQVLEKKEGIFRKHMMGKRVNYACRSVISPDPYIGTTEIGIPLRFAKELTYPQPVADWNVEVLRELVENGTDIYPGANYVEGPSGRLIHLDRLSELRRRGIAARLLSFPGQKVWRHLQDGDCMLVNRQPTLHKPGIMAHRVRVLRNPSYQTIRMHYANCNTYNADFDGDEINCHLPQNEIAKAEANLLAFTDEQYLVPTNGQPLRGLIQDHVDAGVKICSKDCFFTRGEYQQLVYQALSGLPGLEIVPPSGRIHSLPPAIMKPVQRWTGKQVISTILKHLTEGLPQLNLSGKTKTPAVAFGVAEMEHEVIFCQGELLQGVLDKAAFGATQYGLVHAVHELYGGTAAGKLLTGLGRVLTIFLQWAGHTCGIEDLTLTAEAERVRRDIIHKAEGVGQRSMREMLAVQDGVEAASRVSLEGDAKVVVDEDLPLGEDEVESIRQRTATFLVGAGRDERLADIDRHMQSALAPVSSNIIKACLPGGQEKPFPSNSFSLMVLTGGKGSMVNHSQVSCALGQQALEGRRVPLMISGKSLPSFRAFEPSPRANGFITDRFLTGIKPQEYYFHCMAGREGLVDTAVKTSRSGYLQRCLVKHMEELKVGYDNTVRDGEGCVHQFLYGEDGVDTTQTKYLEAKQLDFLAQNYRALRHKYGITSSSPTHAGFESRSAQQAHSAIAASKDRVLKASTNGMSFVSGDDVFARRRARREGKDKKTWGEAPLIDGWHPAKVVKVRHAGTERALYNVRYEEDGSVAKKIPIAIEEASLEEDSQDVENGVGGLATEGQRRGRRKIRRLLRERSGCRLPDPVLSTLSVNKNLGCVSEAFQTSLTGFLNSNPPSLQEKESGVQKDVSPLSLKEAFERLMWVKYMRCLAAPGETVGSIAAQSIGEPSTQMTLNTFHLAGHGGANVTLGIPRLREIIMTAAKNLKTPSTVVPLREGTSRKEADSLALRLSRLSLSMLIDNNGGVVVRERLIKGNAGTWERHYAVCLKLFPTKLIRQAFGIEFKQICRIISSVFTSLLINAITADLRKSGTRLTANPKPIPASAQPSNINIDQDGDEEDPAKEALYALEEGIKASKKANAKYDSEEEDEEQGTFKFGRQKEQATYDGMDDEEKALLKSLNGNGPSDLMDDGGNSEHEEGSPKQEVEGVGNGNDKGDPGEYFVLPTSVTNSRVFKGISKSRTRGEVEVTLRLPSTARRLLMVGLAEAAAEKTMVRSQAGIRGAFVVETASGGKSGLAVQLEGSSFETVWQLKEGMPGGLMVMEKLTSNDIWAMHQAYGVEAARASIVAEITGVFGAYGISVDPRHLGLVADHMTFDGGYRPMNRAGMADFSSPCLQMSFETTAVFLAKAAVAGQYDKLKSPSARIAMGRVGAFGTGMFDLRQPAEVDVEA